MQQPFPGRLLLRCRRALQLEKDKNLAQTEQLQAQANALKAEQVRNQAQETQIRLQGSQLLSQTQTIADIKRQTSIVQAQAMRMETLAARLANLETKGTMGLVASTSEAKRSKSWEGVRAH